MDQLGCLGGLSHQLLTHRISERGGALSQYVERALAVVRAPHVLLPGSFAFTPVPHVDFSGRRFFLSMREFVLAKGAPLCYISSRSVRRAT